MTLERTIEQYANCNPSAVAGGSRAQMMFFVEDAKKDIALLARNIAAKDAEIERMHLRLTALEHSARVGSDIDHERDFLAMEARRYASHYPEASDGRNTFVMFAEMIEARAALKEPV